MTKLIPVFGGEFLGKVSAADMQQGLFCPMLSALNVAETHLNAGLVYLVWVKCCGGAISFSNNFYLVAFTALMLTLEVRAPGIELIITINTDIKSHHYKKKKSFCIYFTSCLHTYNNSHQRYMHVIVNYRLYSTQQQPRFSDLFIYCFFFSL